MTNTKTPKDPVEEIWAKLDAITPDAGPAPAPAPLPRQAPDLTAALEDAQGHELVARIHERKASKPRQLAAAALAGITSGAPRRELNRPKYGKQAMMPIPITRQGTLDANQDLTAGRSRRYAQDLEGWARAALADVNQRGVLVIWDGMFYRITLDADVPPYTITEVHQRDLDAWRARLAG